MKTLLTRAGLVRGAIVAVALAALCLGAVSQTRSAHAEPGPRPNFTLNLKADLTVSYSGHTFFTCSTQTDTFVIANSGFTGTPRFRVAVLAGADSTSFYVGGLAPGETYTRTLVNLNHNQPVLVLVDNLDQVDELDEGNNAVAFTVKWKPCL